MIQRMPKTKHICHQMGKVGSCTVCGMLEDAGIKAEHWHWIMNPDGEFFQKQPLYVRAVRNGTVSGFNVISMVREPMVRNLSGMFQKISLYINDKRQMTPERVWEVFMRSYYHEYPQLWFDTELLGVYGLNYREYPFDRERGYSIYELNGNRFLLIRLENFETALVPALQEFLGVETELQHKNRTRYYTHRDITELYEDAKRLTFPKEFVNQIYDMPHVRHFYTDKEIEGFKRRWSDAI